MEETKKKIPTHVAIIMDGNGRWARERGQERTYGHVGGVESVRACAEAATEAGVKYLSLFAFSEENWSRPASEVNTLMSLMMKSMKEEIMTLMKNDIRFVVLGNRSSLSDELNAEIDSLMERTAGNDRMTMIIFLSYSGKWDILQAARKMAALQAENPSLELSASDFSRLLVTADYPDPDFLIRTSGEQRISNFMLWQTAYTEFYFTPILWPDFRKEAFYAALEEYARRDRRYGKVK